MANTPDHHPPHEPPGSAGVPPASREPKAGTRRRDASAPRDCAPVQGFKAQIRSGNSRPVLLAGPTAVGKSEIALRLAEQLGGEIISADSMQVYRGLDIGTAKPSPADRARVPHHLVDILRSDRIFRRRAIRPARAPRRRGNPVARSRAGFLRRHRTLLQGVSEGLGDAPSADAKLRAELEAAPLEKLLAELRERDPAAYEKIDRQNPRRVIRAVEVIRLDGQTIFRTAVASGARFPANLGGHCFISATILQEQGSDERFPPGFFRVHPFQFRFARPHQRPRGRDVPARSGGRDARIAQARPGGKQNGDAGHRLPAGGGTSARRTVVGGNHRAGENPHPAVCQAATDLVPRPEKSRMD